jgi:hypothetical protein
MTEAPEQVMGRRGPRVGAWLAALPWRQAGFHAGMLLLLGTPLFLFATIPLGDLPNHLARQHVLFGEGAPGAGAYYAVHWRLLPNLAMEAFVFLLHGLLSVETAVRFFLLATVVQLFFGALAVNRALFGRASGFAFAASLFVYNGPFLFGFVNYSFAWGMALWVFALWLGWRDRPLMQPLLALFASAILIGHLFAFALYAVILGTYCLGELGGGLPLMLWRSAKRLAHLALPMAIYLFLVPGELHRSDIDFGGAAFKLAALPGMIGLSTPVFDGICIAAVLAVGLLAVRQLVLAPAMRLPLSALLLLFFILPHRLGEASYVDYRMPSAIALLLVASLGWRSPVAPRRETTELCVLALLALRLGVMIGLWSSWQPVYAAYRAAFDLLPQGARLLPLRAEPEIFDPRVGPPLGHIAAEAVTRRGALIPSLFANLGHQLLEYRAPYRTLYSQAPTAAMAGDFDYVLLVRPEKIPPAAIPPYDKMAEGPTFILGRLAHR